MKPIHFPPPANLPLLNLRLVRQTELPQDKLEIAEASVEALAHTDRYRKTALLTQEVTARETPAARLPMLMAALSAMGSLPSLACVGFELISWTPACHRLDTAKHVLQEVGSTPLTDSALRSPILNDADKSVLIQGTLDGGKSSVLEGRYHSASARKEVARLVIQDGLRDAQGQEKATLELAQSLLEAQKLPQDAFRVGRDLALGSSLQGPVLSSMIYDVACKTNGQGHHAVLEQGLAFLGEHVSGAGASVTKAFAEASEHPRQADKIYGRTLTELASAL